MKISLQLRLMLAFTLVILLTTGLVFGLIWQATIGQASAYHERIERMVSNRIQFTIMDYYFLRGSWDGVETLVTQVGEQFKYRIILTDTDGRMLADSASDNSSGLLNLDKFSSRPLVFHYTGSRQILPMVPPEHGQEGNIKEAPTVIEFDPSFVSPADTPPARPFPYTPADPGITTSQHVGNLFLLPLTQSDIGLTALQLMSNEIGRYFVIGAFLSVVIAMAITFFISRPILAPVRVLTESARKLGKGDLSQRVIIKDSSEIGELSATFNLMAGNLERNERQRRDMVADIAHELRSPLTNIRGYLEAIDDGIIEPDKKTIHSIFNDTLLLSSLIDDLQEMSLAEAGELKLFCQAENIGELVSQSVTAVAARAAGKNLTLSTAVPKDLHDVFVDAMRIKQVLGNLLDNAIAHTPPGGSIIVEAAQSGEMVTISVIDNGEGIPAEELPLIFERFHRVDKSRARKTGGSGLGLTITRYLVEAHHGTITASSEPGKGSKFTITLPVMQ